MNEEKNCPLIGFDLRMRRLKKTRACYQPLELSMCRARIFNPIKEPRNRFPAWWAGPTFLFVVPAREAMLAEPIPRNQFLSRKLKSRYGARNRFQEPSLELSSQAT